MDCGNPVFPESVIFAFLDGFSPETIVTECFPCSRWSRSYGAITYYLSNRHEIDTYLRQVSAESEVFQPRIQDPDFSRKMAKARRQMAMAST